MSQKTDVQRYHAISALHLRQLLSRYQLELVETPMHEGIPGSFWGDEEAGLVGNRVYVRRDTPLHSVLHEACHFICMPPERRRSLDTNAGGDYDEENAVCYLQILLADHLPDSSSERAQQDMDRWGYSFRLGSARAWFEDDAEDARQWLLDRGLVIQRPNQAKVSPSWRLNSTPDEHQQ